MDQFRDLPQIPDNEDSDYWRDIFDPPQTDLLFNIENLGEDIPHYSHYERMETMTPMERFLNDSAPYSGTTPRNKHHGETMQPQQAHMFQQHQQQGGMMSPAMLQAQQQRHAEEQAFRRMIEGPAQQARNIGSPHQIGNSNTQQISKSQRQAQAEAEARAGGGSGQPFVALPPHLRQQMQQQQQQHSLIDPSVPTPAPRLGLHMETEPNFQLIDSIILALDHAGIKGRSKEDICMWIQANLPGLTRTPSFTDAVASNLARYQGAFIRQQGDGVLTRYSLIESKQVLQKLNDLKNAWILAAYNPPSLRELKHSFGPRAAPALEETEDVTPCDYIYSLTDPLDFATTEDSRAEKRNRDDVIDTTPLEFADQGFSTALEDFKSSVHQEPALESTVGDSSHPRTNNLSSTVDRSETKRQSSAPTSQAPPSKKPRIFPATASIVERPVMLSEEHGQVEEQESTLVAGQDGWSVQSSAVNLTPGQRYKITTIFAEALVKEMRNQYAILYDNSSSIPLHQRCQPLLKEFSVKAKASASDKQRQRSLRAVRFLRVEIARKYEALLLGEEADNPYHCRAQPSIVEDLRTILPEQQSYLQKVSEWTQQTNQPMNQVTQIEDVLEVAHLSRFPPAPSDCSQITPTQASTSVISASEEDDLRSAIPAGEQREIFDYLIGHEAFASLVSELSRTVERYYVNTMQFIRKRVVLALKRYEEQHPSEPFDLGVIYSYDLDVVSFLQDQYGNSDTDLGEVLTVTGRPKNAQMLPVSEYMLQTWEQDPLALLDSFRKVLLGENSAISDQSTTGKKIEINLENRMISVFGPPSFVVTVGQQLAWICAACQGAQEDLSTAHVIFDEIPQSSDEFASMSLPKFVIQTEVRKVDPNEVKACWCDFLPNSVIAAGFPIRSRSSGSENGLEIPIQIMATLGGILNAAEYDGGYVLKGRNIAFVPINRRGDSVQWHFVKGAGSRLRYQDLRTLKRLSSTEFREKDLHATRTFLGWCKSVVNSFGTKSFDYHAILPPSNTMPLSKEVLKLTTASVGLSQVLPGMMKFSVSRRRDGYYHAETPHFFQDLLKYIRQIPVIVQDTVDARAYYLDGERFILGAVHHRYSSELSHGNDQPSLHGAQCNDPISVLVAMLKNCNVVLRRDQHMEDASVNEKLYRHEVRELYECLELLQAESENVAEAGIQLQMDWKRYIQGWSYAEFIDGKRKLGAKGKTLRDTCGLWPTLAREISAVVLFGSNFGDIVKPSSDDNLCSAYAKVPENHDFLAIEAQYIKAMLQENRTIPDRGLLTNSGLQLLCPSESFESCKNCTMQTKSSTACRFQRITQLSRASSILQGDLCTAFPEDGGILIGEGPAHYVPDLGGCIASNDKEKLLNNSDSILSTSRPRGTRHKALLAGSGTYKSSPCPRGTRPLFKSSERNYTDLKSSFSSQGSGGYPFRTKGFDECGDAGAIGESSCGVKRDGQLENNSDTVSETSCPSLMVSTMGNSGTSSANAGITTEVGTNDLDHTANQFWDESQDLSTDRDENVPTPFPPQKSLDEPFSHHTTLGRFQDSIEAHGTLGRKRPIDFDCSTAFETKKPRFVNYG